MAIAISDESSQSMQKLQPVWHHKAPGRLIKKCPTDEIYRGWNIWQDHLRTRKKPGPPPFPITQSDSPLLWGWPKALDRNAVRASLQSPSMLAECLIGNDSTEAVDLSLALQIVALAYAMPGLARELPAEAWWPLLERLHEVAIQAETKRVDWPADPLDVLGHQLLAGELPFVLAYLLPEVRAMRALRKSAHQSLSEAVVALTDGCGTPDARLLRVLGPLFACWTRVRWLGSQSGRRPWSREAEQQYRWLLRRAIRLADKSGRFMLTASDDTPQQSPERAWEEEQFATAIKLAGNKSDLAAAAVALPRGAVEHRAKRSSAHLPHASLNSEWAGITIMAEGWSQSQARLAIAFVENP
ncbi:MAG TPA: hypothetical protein VFW73_02045, partial [Lacipirellulaceae bacterium]|nr:hypothetical protein [Lacipirellulaceae bacterium]